MRSPEKSSLPQVVAGLICLDQRVLVAKRKSSDSGGGFWEFPGGKVEPLESLEEALVREIQEELELPIDVTEKLASQQITTFRGQQIELILMAARALSETFVLHDHEEAEWRHWADLDSVGFSSGNRSFLPLIHNWFTLKR